MKRIISLMLSLIIILSLVCGAVPAVSAASAMKTSDQGINMIKAFEGFHKWPQMDNGQWTVGYGTGIPESKVDQYNDNGITDAQAVALLKEYLAGFEKSVNSFIDANNLKLNQQQFDALVSFTYNLGPSWMQASGTFRSAVISGAKGNDFIFAMAQFGKAGGSPVGGLIERRLCEANLYLNGLYSTTPPANFKYVIYQGNMDGVVPTVSIQGYNSSLSTAIKSSVTAASGYRFLGWYTATEGGEWVTSVGPKTAATTKLYARWQNGEGPRNSDGSIKGTAASYTGYLANGDSRSVYKTPNGTKVGTVSGDTKVTVIADYMDSSNVKWGKISNGWIKLFGSLTTTPVYEESGSAIDPITVTVTTGGVNNRIGPGTNYAKNGTYTKGQQLTLTAIQKGGNYKWGKSEQGWIALQFTDYETSKLQNSESAKKVTAIGTIIRANYVNVRAGAGTKHAKVGSYQRNEEVKISLTQKVGNVKWGLTEKGWISMYYVKLADVEDTDLGEMNFSGSTSGTTGTTGSTITGNGTTVISSGKIYNCKTLRIRAAAGTANAHVGDYESGTYVNIYETTTVGSQIWGRTDKGWISLRYVKLDAPTTGAGVTGRVFRTNTVNVRSGAGTHFPKVASLAKGTKVEIFEYVKVGNATWGRTSQGWVSLYYVSLDAPLSNLDKIAVESVPVVTEPEATEPTATKYGVTIANATNGKVTASAKSAAKGDVVALTVTPNAGYVLDSLTVKNASGATVSVANNKFTMPASKVTVTATFKAKYDVTVASATNGKVTANVASACKGDEVALTITPNANYILDTLTVKDAKGNVVTVTNNKFTMPESKVTVTATFKIQYNVNIQTATGGKVTANVTACDAGKEVILTATPNAGYELENISIINTATNAHVDMTGMNKFIMPAANVNVVPTFKQSKSTAYAVKVEESANGKVTANLTSAKKGAIVELTVRPDADYELDKLIVRDASNNLVDEFYGPDVDTVGFNMPASAVNVTATFKTPDYEVKIANASGGTVTIGKTGTYKKGDTVTITATPSDYYELKEVSVKNGSTVIETKKDGANYTFTMPAGNVDVKATFSKIQYKLTIIENAGGKLTADKETYTKGETVTLSIKPGTGYTTGKMVVKNGSEEIETTGKGYNFTFKMPGADITAEHQFKKFEYALSIATNSNGVIKADKEKYGYQDTVTLTIEPRAGYAVKLVQAKDNGAAIEVKEAAKNKYTFSMPASDKVSVAASYEFIPVAYKVTNPSGEAVNVRDAASTGSVIGHIPNGETIEVQEIKDDWAKVEYDEITGWVSMTLLTKK